MAREGFMLRAKAKSRVTLADVAREAGVSVSTVSAVLGKRPHCYAAQATKDHVSQVARTLGYRPNLMARSLRGQSTHTIGVLVHGLKGPGLVHAKLQSIEDTAWRHQYRMLLGTHKDEYARLDAYLEEMLSRSVDGIVFQSPSPEGLKAIEMIRRTNTPLVTIEAHPRYGTWDVGVDRAAGAMLQVRHVLELGRKPAFFFTAYQGYTGTEKIRGIRMALQEAGHALDDFPVLERWQVRWPTKAGAMMTQELIDSGRSFDAIITMSDMVAQGVIATLLRRGLRVPQDVAVVGYDDEFSPEGMTVPLTSVHQPRNIGQSVFDLLFRQINARTMLQPQQIMLQPRLVVRESSVAGAGPGLEPEEVENEIAWPKTIS